MSQSGPTFAAAAAAVLFEIANPAQTQQANMEEKRGERMDWVEKEQDRMRRNNIDEAMDRLKNKTDEQLSKIIKEHSNHYQRSFTEILLRDRCRERGEVEESE